MIAAIIAAAIIAAGVIVAWLGVLVAMSDRRVKKPRTVTVTITADTEAMRKALNEAAGRMGVALAEFSRQLGEVNRALAAAAPSIRKLNATLEREP